MSDLAPASESDPSRAPISVDSPIEGRHRADWAIDPVARRLHPISPLINVPKRLAALLPLIAIIFFTKGNDETDITLIVLIAITGGSVLSAFVRWFTLRYTVDRDRLIIRSGWIFRSTRTIPLARIKTVDMKQGLLHRIFQVVDARIETAGDEGAEAVLSVLSRKEADSLRDELLRRRVRDAPEPPPHAIHVSSVFELLIAGATENRAGAITAGLFGLLEFASDLGDEIREPLSRTFDDALGAGASTQVALVVASVLSLLVIGWVVSIVITTLTWFGFRLEQRGDSLRKVHGLITRIDVVIPRPRIQVLRLDANLPRRWLKRTVVRVETAGSAREGSGAGATTLVPLARRDEVPNLCRAAFDDLPQLDLDNLVPVHPLSKRRGFIRFALVALLLHGTLWVLLGPQTLLAFPGSIVIALFLAHARYRALGWSREADVLLARSGLWTRRTWILPVSKIQSLAVASDPFQRRLGLASLRIDTAGAGHFSRATIVDLAREQAEALFERLASQTAETDWTVSV